MRAVLREGADHCYGREPPRVGQVLLMHDLGHERVGVVVDAGLEGAPHGVVASLCALLARLGQVGEHALVPVAGPCP